LVGVTLFANAADTRTQGVELMFNYHSNFGDWGSVDWTVAGNYNETSVLSVTPAPAPIANLGSLLTPTTISDLTTAAPREKVLLGGFWTIGRWAVNLRETIYGPVREVVSPDQTGSGPGAVVLHVGTTAITDLDVAYHLTDQVRIAVGANNLFNKKAPVLPALGLVNGATIYNAPITITPWGVNGGYYYTKLTYTF
jgi:iron complex outermembrane receptor protein